MAESNQIEVRVTIKCKSPRGYAEQDILVEERASFGNSFRLLREPIVQGPSITFDTHAASNLQGRHLLISTGCRNIDSLQMYTCPIPTSAVSDYVRIQLSSLSLEDGPVNDFASALYSIVIVDLQRRYVHMFVTNLRVQSPSFDMSMQIVPYEAPPVSERSFRLGFVALRQANHVALDDEMATTLRDTRSFDVFLNVLHGYNLRIVGSTWLQLGPEVPLQVAPAA